MYLAIRDLEREPISFDLQLDAGVLDLELAKQQGPILAKGVASFRESTEEIAIDAEVKATLELTCDRCLAEFPFVFDRRVELTYSPEGAEEYPGEQEIKEPETEIGFHDGKGLELHDVLQEQLMLALPLKVLCREDCAGLCPVCGKNRNEEPCQCVVKPTDERWAGLLQS